MPSEDTGNPANENRRDPRAPVTPKRDLLLPASGSAFSLLPAPSELGYSCTALPSQVDASSNANSGYFYYYYLKSLVSSRKCIGLVQAIGSAGVLGRENNIILERKLQGFKN